MQKLRFFIISISIFFLAAVFPVYSGGTKEKDQSGQGGNSGATSSQAAQEQPAVQAAGQSTAGGQPSAGQSASGQPAADLSDPDREVPVDEQVRMGTLPNGLVYYIRENKKPAGRAELRLVVNAGSVLEDGDQLGLAHFVEHMAFNGTEHFTRNSLIDYLEPIGMEFGPEINAYTSFDETVYMLHVPTKDMEVFRNGFLILSDWAGGFLFDPAEVDKERGVIVEEWRQGRGADARILDKQLPVIFTGSRYAERLPIGKKETIESFPHEVLKRFYHDWYRPGLMAVVAVGDFNADEAEALIRELFSGLQEPPEPRERVVYPPGRTEEPVYAIATDPEATYAVASLYFKRDPAPERTVGDYRRILENILISSMMNDRLAEVTEQSDPPFAAAYCGYTSLVRSSDVFIVQSLASAGGLLPAFQAAAEETFRASEHGFTADELDRAKKNILSLIRQQYRERDKTESASYASQYVTHFLKGTMIPSVGWELAAVEGLFPGISLDDVNGLISEYVTLENLAVLIDAPEKPGFVVPAEAELVSVLERYEAGGTTAYTETGSGETLLESPPVPGKIVKRERIAEIDSTLFTLSNGVRVLFKRTENKEDQVLLRSFSPGGLSLVSDEEYVSGMLSTDLAVQSGVGPFSRTGLDRFLAGKQVQVSPYIDDTTEGFSGYSSVEDFPVMLELVYAYATRYKVDQDAYASFMTRLMAVLENQMAMPEVQFSYRFQNLLFGGNPRKRPLTPDVLKETDPGAALRIFGERFRDLGDSMFVIVGSISLDEAAPLIEKYIAALPAGGKAAAQGGGSASGPAAGSTAGMGPAVTERIVDRGIRYAGKRLSDTVYAGVEEKSAVILAFSGPCVWSEEEDFRLGALAQALTIRLREVLREDEGGTYGVGVSSAMEKIPAGQYLFRIVFFCSPDRAEELTALAMKEIETFTKGPVDPALVTKVREIIRAGHERNMEDNGYILSLLVDRCYLGLPLEKPFEIASMDEKLEPAVFSEMARKYLDTGRLLSVTLYPGRLGGVPADAGTGDR